MSGRVREFTLVREDIARYTSEVEALCAECDVEVLRCADGTVNAAKIKDNVFRVMSADMRE